MEKIDLLILWHWGTVEPDNKSRGASGGKKEASSMHLSGTTTMLGLMGTPVAHSKSPAMYNHCFAKYGLDWAYLAFDVTQEQTGAAVQAIRTLDDTRLVDEASGWFDRGGGDVHSIHNYFYPLRIRPNMRTVALSEYGGIAWPMPGHEPPRKTYGYGTARSRAELTERYCDLQRKTVLPQLKKGLSALVYTQLTDVEDEVNGLFTYDRTAIKPDAAAVRAVNEALEAEFEKAVKA